MTSAEVGSLSIAILSLLVSSVAAYWSYTLSHRQLRLGSRHEFQKLLLELNKELVRDPELWGVYDSHPMARLKRDEPAHKAKLEAFAYMTLNVFQIVFVYMEERDRAGAPERAFFEAWKGFLHDSVSDCSIIREILSRPSSDIVYDRSFLAKARRFIEG